MDGYGDEFLSQSAKVSLTIAELVDLIEAGSIAEHESGWDFPVLAKLREQFTRLVQDLNADADQV